MHVGTHKIYCYLPRRMHSKIIFWRAYPYIPLDVCWLYYHTTAVPTKPQGSLAPAKSP